MRKKHNITIDKSLDKFSGIPFDENKLKEIQQVIDSLNANKKNKNGTRRNKTI